MNSGTTINVSFTTTRALSIKIALKVVGSS